MNFDLKIQFQPKNYLNFLILQKTQIQHVHSNTHGVLRPFDFLLVKGPLFNTWRHQIWFKVVSYTGEKTGKNMVLISINYI